MNPSRLGRLAVVYVVALANSTVAADRYLEVTYPPSQQAGELRYGVTFTLWLPDGVTRFRGIIVHQHGCGEGACKGGETAAYDLHWQALARKWDCALLGPSYHQPDKQDCRLWCDPRNGSNKTFLRALRDLARKAEHAELEQVPWCLWGHSGGGYWASVMQVQYPERIVAIWFRSGTASISLDKSEKDAMDVPAAAFQIPTMYNPGAKENGNKKYEGAWIGTLKMFKAYRARGAPTGFAPDPRSAHDCGDSRYLAIPFFDACLALRLPNRNGMEQKLKPVDLKQGWLAPLLGDTVQLVTTYPGKAEEAVWLPNERVAMTWSEYVKTGAVSDTTPPPAPTSVLASAKPGGTEVTWEATADFESGLQGFIIERDGREVARVPEKPIGKFGRPLFQTMSFHDTPEKPLPRMSYLDRSGEPGQKHTYRAIAVNSVGLRSKPSQASAR